MKLFKMKLLAGGLVAALLLPVLAPCTEAHVGPSDSPPASARLPLYLASEDTADAQEEGATGSGDEAGSAAPSWYRMTAATPQPEAPAVEQDYFGRVKEGLENMKGQLSKVNTEQIRDVAVAQLKSLRLPPALMEQKAKFSLLMQRWLSDPEVRKNLGLVALGAAGMLAAGILLGDLHVIQEMTIVALYMAGLFHAVRGGAQLAGRVVNEISKADAVKKTDMVIREEVAKMLGIRPERKSQPPDEQ